MRKAASAGTDLRVELAGVEMRNPIMLASGILGETGDLLIAAHRAGAGAVVTKSIGLEPRDGHKNPCVFQTECGMLNAMGLPNPGIAEFGKEMAVLKSSGAVVVGSIFGARPQDFAKLARKMQDYGAAALELNLSCPHAKGLGSEIGSNPATVRSIVSEVVGEVDIPVFAKLTPNTRDICSLGLAAEEAGAKGVVAINTLRAMAIDPYLRRPVLANRFGGLSGPGIRPIGVRCVFELSASLSIPIIGVGGISEATDVVEYIMAGASAVQVGTAVQQKGVEIFTKLPMELAEFMSREGYKNIDQMRGIANEG